MPTYDYECPDCSIEFEQIRKMDDRYKSITCPECGFNNSTRILKLGAGGFVDPGILKADKNMEISGVGKRLSEMKAAHPYMVWSG